MNKQKILFPKMYCVNCNRVKTNWNQKGLCDSLTIGKKFDLYNLEEIKAFDHNWRSIN